MRRPRRRSRQQWYVAVLIFCMPSSSDDKEKVFVRHELRLIRAISDQAAYEHALFLGRAADNGGTFTGIHELRWLIDIPRGSAKVRKLSPRDGVCLYHFILRGPQAWPVLSKDQLT